MPGFVITSVFEVSAGRVPLGPAVLAQVWGRGHRFSYCDGRTLTLVAEITAGDARSAFEVILTRTESLWRTCGFGTLERTVTMRVQEAVRNRPVPAGLPGSGTASARRKRHKQARQLKYFSPAENRPPELPDDDEPDDGGLAGVREPRQPRPSPPGLAAALDLPWSGGPEAGWPRS